MSKTFFSLLLAVVFSLPAYSQVFTVKAGEKSSSGFIVKKGIGCMCRHGVTRVGEKIKCGPYDAKVIYIAKGKDDIAFAKIDVPEGPPVEEVRFPEVRPMIGEGLNAPNLVNTPNGSTFSAVNGVLTEVSLCSDGRIYRALLKTYPGCSGTPVYNGSSQVVGMRYKASSSGDVGWIITYKTIQKHLKRALESQKETASDLKEIKTATKTEQKDIKIELKLD